MLLTKLKKSLLHLKFGDTNSKVSTCVSCRDNNILVANTLKFTNEYVFASGLRNTD